MNARLVHSSHLGGDLTYISPSNRSMSPFDVIGPLTSINSSYGASSLGRPIAFGNFVSTTVWLPVRAMTPCSSPLTIKSARSASGAAFPYGKFYATADRNPIYRVLLQYGIDEPSSTSLHPLQSLRQAMHQALYIHNRQRARSLPTIEKMLELYTALLGQGSLEPVDTLVIARLLTLALLVPLDGNCSLEICWYLRQPLRDKSFTASQRSEHATAVSLWHHTRA